MSLLMGGKEIYIIDRTLLNLMEFKENLNYHEVLLFMKMLKKLGTDYFEIDIRVFSFMQGLLPQMNYILRIEEPDEIDLCRKMDVAYILINEEYLKKLQIEQIHQLCQFHIIIEITIESGIDNLMGIINRVTLINEILDFDKIDCIRIRGIRNCYCEGDRVNLVLKLKESFAVKLDVYPCNSAYMATAAGFDALHKGFDSITTTFSGRDGSLGTAALEEIILSLKVISGAVVRGDISIMALMKNLYQNLTGLKVGGNKSIIGEDIFKYESGIHADGIEKNPLTYEPFKPESIGMTRKLMLGKHSGKNSVAAKLRELGIENLYSDHELDFILKEIKKKSILRKANVTDEEFIELIGILKK